jgi:uncharacterized protein YjbI with pentapeptide repeats
MSDEPGIRQPAPAASRRDTSNQNGQDAPRSSSAQWKPSAQELKQILGRHRGWLANEHRAPLPEHDRYLEDVEPAYPEWLDGARGQPEQANLSGANLFGANLCGAFLMEANLSGANLLDANLSSANLSSANLSRAMIVDANLSGANLGLTNLNDADLFHANMRGADLGCATLIDANLIGAFLTEANLSGADLSHASLNRADLSDANLNRANLSGANLYHANLIDANLSRAMIVDANLSGANLSGAARLRGAKLYDANLIGANLRGADLTDADLSFASASGANLSGATLTHANLSGAKLEHVRLVVTNLEGATVSNCHVYGISAWDVRINGKTEQLNLIVTPQGDAPVLSVDNLEVAQFIYLLVNNKKIRHVIDTITSKAVLILGRFTEGRKRVLDALRDELRKRDYVPILFDFEKPSRRDLTETVTLLARMARFIIADLTDPRSIPHELYAIVPDLRNVPVQPLLLAGTETYGMFDDLLAYQWVLPTYRYTSVDGLLDSLAQSVIEPAEAKVIELKAQSTERSRK